ncbi:small GTPase Ran binding protein 1 [Capsaspora owczarzaki ATCC 30864]|uniref:Small GTPase Ran binding protein 1 n=1 Tax=Capsaspora owczarzaki (strain ATCC 30864) TaxID=595528 RepID=A0A0D2WSX0_CAPO3|nr:small GTPase Ran binding protein 1 [Capsaspora owczarzaki ATCC 30864]KJE95425.1 small GTPase Ran binding protein 1 [Capsaspora owczarzaki ATCC 30864]|eukprot:XP_004345470.1 small GTPase Ran binding protein 1 [Capsaspora owczarzaki ATCC 30864]
MADDDREEPTTGDDKDEVVESNDVHFEPIVKLNQVEVKTLEEDEDVLFKIRAKLFRFDKPTGEWKERGTGEVKFLQDRTTKMIRLLMRRDKTLKVCANHIVRDDMVLQTNVGSDRAWVWNVVADFADNEPKPETLAIRFANAENAKLFKDKFEESGRNNASNKGQTPAKGDAPSSSSSAATPAKEDDAAKVAEKLGDLKVADKPEGDKPTA